VSARYRMWWIAANVVVPAGFVALMVWVLASRWGELQPVFEHPVQTLVLITALIVIGFFLNAWEFLVLYRAQRVPIGWWENWMVFSAGQAGNLIPAQMGTIYKFRYMKAVHDLAYTRNGSNAGANLVISVGSSAVVGVVGVVAVGITTGRWAWAVLAIFAAMAVGAAVAMAVPLPKVRFLKGTAARFWDGFHGGWEELRRQPGAAVTVLAIDLVKYVVTAWRFQLAFGLVGVDEGYWFFLVLAPAAGIAGILSFTPGGLGLREGFLTLAAVAMGTTAVDGLLGATVDRGLMLVVVVVVGAVAFAYTWPRLRAARRAGASDGSVAEPPVAPAAPPAAPRHGDSTDATTDAAVPASDPSL
jgi:uncharacterized membrane protein YbhN (UPF0104 family)